MKQLCNTLYKDGPGLTASFTNRRRKASTGSSCNYLIFSVMAGIIFTCSLKEVKAQPDYWANLVYFSGCPVNHIPKGITIPDKDKQCRLIMNAIIDGKPEEELQELFPDSLETKLNKLINGHVIKRVNNSFEIAFPVLTGETRQKMMEIVHRKISGINLPIDSLTAKLAVALKDHPEMVFHFLWSRVMDDCWWNWYNLEFKTEQGPPDIAFIVHPPHPMQCGTNSDYSPDNSQFAFSWSYNLFDEFFRIPPTESFYNLALNKPIPEKDREFFIHYGLLDSNNVSHIFCYYENSQLDSLCEKLKTEYISIVRGLFDYEKLSNELHVQPDDLFLVISHEVAYEIFSMLNNRNTGLFIPIIRKDNPIPDFSPLISWKLVNQPKE